MGGVGYYGGVAFEHYHYERAFEASLRAGRIPYVSVNEARKSLLPPIGRFPDLARVCAEAGESGLPDAIKNFDFILYGAGGNTLVDIKGRRLPSPRARVVPQIFTSAGIGQRRAGCGGSGSGAAGMSAGGPCEAGNFGSRALPVGALNSWVTAEDIASLRLWQRLFGPGFTAEFVFMYWCDAAPGDGLFDDIVEHDGKWYGLKRVAVDEYAGACKQRSARWKTVDVPSAAFARMGRRVRVA